MSAPEVGRKPYKDRPCNDRLGMGGRRVCWADGAFERQREIDPVGERAHAVAACVGFALVAAPTSVAELAFAVPGVAWLIRFHRHWRVTLRLIREPAFVLLLAWLGWRMVATAWSPDRAQGWDELGVSRFALLAVFSWPALAYRRWFLPALLFGFGVGEVVQLGHGLGLALGVEWLVWPRAPGRVSGWWDPVVGGSLLVGVLGVHLGGMLWARGAWRAVGVVGSGATAAAMVGTGTRGAWIAGAALVVLAGGWRVVAWLRARADLARRPAGRGGVGVGVGVGVGAVVALGVAAAVWLGREGLAERVAAGREEVASAIERRDFSTNTGARLGMALAAVDAARAHPVFGVGTGGYQAWTLREWVPREGNRTLEPHAHAHNAGLHELATAGLVGALLASCFALAVLRGAARPVAGDAPPGVYRPGLILAVLGLGLVSVFDPVHLNAQTAQLLAALALCSASTRPPPA